MDGSWVPGQQVLGRPGAPQRRGPPAM